MPKGARSPRKAHRGKHKEKRGGYWLQLMEMADDPAFRQFLDAAPEMPARCGAYAVAEWECPLCGRSIDPCQGCRDAATGAPCTEDLSYASGRAGCCGLVLCGCLNLCPLCLAGGCRKYYAE